MKQFEAAVRAAADEGVPPLEVTLAEREAVDSSQLNNLFIESPRRQPPRARKPPVVQSDSSLSSSEEAELTDDSLFDEITMTSKKTKHKSTSADGAGTERRPRRKSAQSASEALKRATTTPKRKSATKPSPAKPSPSESIPHSRTGHVDPVPTQRRASTTSELASAATGSANITPARANSGTAKRSVSFTTQVSPSNITSDTGKNGAIKFTNQPKPPPRQISELNKTHFRNLKGRGAANKKSAREGTPDPSALQIVNAPPGTTISLPRAPRDDLYGRREPSHRRPTEDSNSDVRPSRQSTDGNLPLEDWESHKVPLCNYAHYNTGWMKHTDPKVPDVRIDPEKRPEFNGGESQSGDKFTKKALAPNQLTCWYWKNTQCRKSDQDCAFQHYDTGIVADGPHGSRQKPVRPADGSDESDASVHMDIDDVAQPDVADEVTRSPSPMPLEQPQQPFQPPPPPPPPMEFPPVDIRCTELQERISAVSKLDFEDMFATNDGETTIDPVERRAFLFFHPEDHFVEFEIITRWLLMHHVQVSSASYAGGWADFQQQILKGGTGIIIAHPDFEYFTSIPGFGQVLRRGVRLWSVGLQPGIEYDYASDETPVVRNDRIEIFPVGGFIYITDEVFEAMPRYALCIIKLFLAKITKLKELAGPSAHWPEIVENSLLWRLCVRPELMEHLFAYCEDQATELQAGDADVQSAAELYSLLTNPNYIEQDSPDAPFSLKADKHPILSERRAIAECEPVDYFNTLKRSQQAANLNMIRYYAGLQVDMRRDYRHFYVVHTEPTASYVKEWKQEIQTIAEVITPGRCIKEFKKSGQDSMFNFFEDVMAGDVGEKGTDKDGDATRTG
ncbi:uncharacterized protein J4E78_008358 [Alternaria triticimaculans]|uniref:uncharacterized protein n=1 Tax=Alternaria triticimaculans TaxID=297637 RepID=UPI0020C5097E|nr:uncharacterized protein J4E78_008358 [Alternaria triticimaculans]KAI4650076.1 hypothetical protein J4E78_008358 [Alternaria triticimaculans]